MTFSVSNMAQVQNENFVHPGRLYRVFFYNTVLIPDE